MKDLVHYSLDAGSKDNMTAYLAIFGHDNQYSSNFNELSQYQPGPYHPYSHNETFRQAYLDDAKRHGLEGEALFKLAREVEKDLPQELIDEAQQQSQQNQMSQGQQLMAFMNILNENGMGHLAQEMEMEINGNGNNDDDNDDEHNKEVMM